MKEYLNLSLKMLCDYGLFYYLIRIKIKLDLFLIYFSHDTTSYLIIF